MLRDRDDWDHQWTRHIEDDHQPILTCDACMDLHWLCPDHIHLAGRPFQVAPLEDDDPAGPEGNRNGESHFDRMYAEPIYQWTNEET